MKAINHLPWIVLVSLGLLNAACPVSSLAIYPTETVQPPTETPTSPPPPTETATATAINQAFFCIWNSTPTPVTPQCSLPTGDERDEFCVSQVPYTLIAIPTEDTYKVITPGIVCTDAGVKNNNLLLTCTGPPSYSFAFEICNAACVVPTATTAPAPAGVCPEGFNYLPDQNCCSAIASNQTGCTTAKFNLRACGQPNCNKIKDIATCNATFGCGWVPGNGTAKSACVNK